MHIVIRQEKEKDHKSVFELIEKAFKDIEVSDHMEQHLVERLRKSEAFIPELSLVAEDEGMVIGHILLTKIKIKNWNEEFESLILAPVSVLPDYQNFGIGGKLIIKAHEIATKLGYKSILLVGHEIYYPRFGYKLLSSFNIKQAFSAPDKNCMAKELVPDALDKVNGIVIYPPEFFG